MPFVGFVLTKKLIISFFNEFHFELTWTDSRTDQKYKFGTLYFGTSLFRCRYLGDAPFKMPPLWFLLLHIIIIRRVSFKSPFILYIIIVLPNSHLLLQLIACHCIFPKFQLKRQILTTKLVAEFTHCFGGCHTFNSFLTDFTPERFVFVMKF